jgi:glucose 1-dehydrogenase
MQDPAKPVDTAIPLERMAQPTEIAAAAAFLAGDGASYLATAKFGDGGIMQGSSL